MDAHCTMVWAGLPLKSNHGGKRSAVGFVTGNARMFDDSAGDLTLKGSTGATYQRLDQMLEHADTIGDR